MKKSDKRDSTLTGHVRVRREQDKAKGKGILIVLDESNILGTLPEALTAHVQVVLPDDGALVSCWWREVWLGR